jgi:methylated-DNA-[protein]-cysteine S-methyltransferase
MRPPRPLCTHRFESPLGPIRLAASASGLCGLWFEGQKHGPTETVTAQWTPAPEHPWLLSAEAHVLACLSGHHHPFSLPLDLSDGTPFQQSVWQALLLIPVGASQSYGQLAHQLGKPQAVRAVGAAVGHNPVSIIVPCHRILGAGGQLTGYAGGLWRKQALLKLEGHPAAA